MFLTAKETAARLNVSVKCVYSLIESGKLIAHRIGVGRGTLRIAEEDLTRFLSESKVDVAHVVAGKLRHINL